MGYSDLRMTAIFGAMFAYLRGIVQTLKLPFDSGAEILAE